MHKYIRTLSRAVQDRSFSVIDFGMLVAGMTASATSWLVEDLKPFAPAISFAVASITIVSVVAWRLLRHATRLEAQPQMDTTLQAAAHYLAKGKWPKPDQFLVSPLQPNESEEDWRARVVELPGFNEATTALRFLRQAAVDGSLTVWARPQARRCFDMALNVDQDVLFKKLNPDHWDSYIIDPYHLALKPEQTYTVRKGSNWMKDSSVCSLMVSRDQVELLRARHSVLQA